MELCNNRFAGLPGVLVIQCEHSFKCPMQVHRCGAGCVQVGTSFSECSSERFRALLVEQWREFHCCKQHTICSGSSYGRRTTNDHIAYGELYVPIVTTYKLCICCRKHSLIDKVQCTLLELQGDKGFIHCKPPGPIVVLALLLAAVYGSIGTVSLW